MPMCFLKAAKRLNGFQPQSGFRRRRKEEALVILKCVGLEHLALVFQVTKIKLAMIWFF